MRLTGYGGTDQGWCGFHESLHPAQFVRADMTIAIAEPYDGGSYGGAPGEACGECWEVDSVWGTPQILMVSNLCPATSDNPLCQGSFFHFDLAPGAVTALGGTSTHQVAANNAAVARRVACPVSGSMQLEIVGHNQYGYVGFQVVNHRIPVRRVEFKAQGTSQWLDATREGYWHVLNGGNTFLGSGPGGTFRVTSAQGEVVESAAVLRGTDTATVPYLFDLGVQFTDLQPTTGPQCVFEPPGDVYLDGWGGIPSVTWEYEGSGYGGASPSTTSTGCFSGSCLQISGMQQFAGFRIRYRQGFPTGTFSTLTMKVKAASGAGTINIEPSLESDICAETIVTPGAGWTTVTIPIASVCGAGSKYGAKPELNAITISKATGGDMTLLLDDVQYLR